MHGWVNVFKPSGMSSMDVIRQLRRIANTKKIGHIGTLDPLASGVLPVAIGEATKTIAYCPKDKGKLYQFTLCLGEQRDTDDDEGRVIGRTDHLPNRNEIEAILPQFQGKISQKPPLYSAIKIKGERAYKLARKGEEVDIPLRDVLVHKIEIIDQMSACEYVLKVHCHSGTYMRSLARDIAIAVGSLGFARDIHRLVDGIFSIENSHRLEDIKANGIDEHILLPAQFVLDAYQEIELEGQSQMEDIRHGRAITLSQTSSKLYKNEDFTEEMIYVTYVKNLIAIGEKKDYLFKPKKVFHI